MRQIRPILILFLFVLAVAPAAWANDTVQPYVQAQLLSPQLLPPPPEEGSAAWRAQISAVEKAQRHLSSAEIAAIQNEQKMRLDLLTAVMGSSFTRDHLPKTFALLDRVMVQTAQVSEADKKFWHTRRPYLTDKHVKLYIDRIDQSPSYPSGHTSESRVLAEVLGMLAPDKLTALRARADEIALHRIEGGAHYPVDIDGGRSVAMLVVGALVANDDFQDDLTEARNEIAGQ